MEGEKDLQIISEDQNPAETENNKLTVNEQANTNPMKKILICFLGVVVLSLIGWQIIGSVLFNSDISSYAADENSIGNRMETLLNGEGFSLVQILQGLKDIQKENQELLIKANTVISKNKYILFKNTNIVNGINCNNSKIEQLLSGSKELTSAVQRSEQLDKDIELMLNSKAVTWKNTIDKCDTLINNNETIKNDLVKAVIPEELKMYQDIPLRVKARYA